MPSYQVALLVFGILLILVGLVGRVKAKELEVGTDSKVIRAVIGLLGVLFVGLSFNPEAVKTFPPFSNGGNGGEGGTSAGAETQAPTAPLSLWWSAARTDNFSTATQSGENSAMNAGYVRVRTEALVFPTQVPGTVPLVLYWHAEREDNFTTATPDGASAAEAAGYTRARIEGYVYPENKPGSVPLKLYWHAERKDNFTTATPEGASAAQAAGYRYVRVEGYAGRPQ